MAKRWEAVVPAAASLFVCAGCIGPMGVPVQNTSERQGSDMIKVYPGRDAGFALYDDDGTTNGYAKGGNDKAGRLSASDGLPTGQAPATPVRVAGRGLAR